MWIGEMMVHNKIGIIELIIFMKILKSTQNKFIIKIKIGLKLILLKQKLLIKNMLS